MPRPEKVAVVEKVREELSNNPATLLTEYRGLTVGELAELRNQLREAGARYIVVKNTLARIAAREAGFEELEAMLIGPTALTVCDDDPVGPAKALRKFAKDHPELVVKGGILDGRIVDKETAEKLADLESREELLAKLAGMMYAMLANTASILQAPLSKMARLVAALEEKGENPPGEPSADAAGDAAEPAAEESEEAAPAEEPETAEDAVPDDEPEAASTEEPETAEDAVPDDEPEAVSDEESEPVEAAEVEADEEPEAAEADAPEAEAAEPSETEEPDESGAGVTGAVAQVVETATGTAASVVETVGSTVADAVETATGAASDLIEGAGETAADAVASDEDDDEESEADDDTKS